MNDANTDSTPTLRAEEYTKLINQQVSKVVGKLPLLGAVTWLLMQQAATRHTLLSELEWRVMPALVLEQAKLFLRDGTPLAYLSWARLSEEAAGRFAAAPHHLTGADWQSGEQIWIVDLCAPFGGAKAVIDELRKQVGSGHLIHQRSVDAQGAPSTRTWAGLGGADSSPKSG